MTTETEVEDGRYVCPCGARFPTMGEKRRHMRTCDTAAAQPQSTWDDYLDDAHIGHRIEDQR